MDNGRRKLLVAMLSIVLLAGLAVWLCRRIPKQAFVQAPAGTKASQAFTSAALTRQAPAGLWEKLHTAATGLVAAQGDREARQRLAQLRQALDVVPAREAAAAIRRFLESKADASNPKGNMSRIWTFPGDPRCISQTDSGSRGVRGDSPDTRRTLAGASP
jgi:hypothetical protein